MSINFRDDLLKLIPASQRKPEQVPRWNDTRDSPTYTLLRDPINLNELNNYNHRMAIWRDNNTLAYVFPSGTHGDPDLGQKLLSLMFHDNRLILYIVGKTDNAIGRADRTEQKSFVGTFGGNRFDFRDAGTQILEHILEISPSRQVTLGNLKLSKEQSVVVASRFYPIRFALSHCKFEDEGDAFVGAIEKRKSSFGSLTFEGNTGLTEDILKRLLQVDRIDELRFFGYDDQLALLPFSAKVNHLHHTTSVSALLTADFQTVDIAPKKLSLHLYPADFAFPTELMLLFLRRVASLGHFEGLKLGFYVNVLDMDIPDCVISELIFATLANSNLEVLDLSNISYLLNWNPHVGTLLEGLKEHKGLRELKLTADAHAFGPDYSYLHQFLSHNRHIAVTDEKGKIYSNRSSIDELYSLNRFYRGSADLAVKPPAHRSLLVASTLMESASNDFQRSALLLSNHVDVLHEMVQVARLDEICEDDGSTSRLKRSMRIQPTRAAKKSARSLP